MSSQHVQGSTDGVSGQAGAMRPDARMRSIVPSASIRTPRKSHRPAESRDAGNSNASGVNSASASGFRRTAGRDPITLQQPSDVCPPVICVSLSSKRPWGLSRCAQLGSGRARAVSSFLLLQGHWSDWVRAHPSDLIFI